MSEEESPDELDESPDAGVRQANKKPIAIVGALLCLIIILAILGVNANKKRHEQKKEQETKGTRVENAQVGADAVTQKSARQGEIAEKKEKPAERFHGKAGDGLIDETDTVSKVLNGSPLSAVGSEPPSRQQFDDVRRKRLEAALTAVTTVATANSIAKQSKAESGPSNQQSGTGQNSPGTNLTVPGRPAGDGTGTEDANQQGSKRKFSESSSYVGVLAATREAPISKYTVNAGTVIPAALLTAINSDLPGMIKAIVTQNVYDSATGNYLLIPQGSMLLGVYNSEISVGQSRVQVAWNRVNFPDGSTLELGGMAGTDEAGQSGFNDQVNNHFFRIYKDAFMLSMLSAGAQLSQPQPKTTNGQLTPQQQITAAMGQQFAETGMEITKRNMQIQPTLEIRPGYRFNIFVSKDVILRPYTDK